MQLVDVKQVLLTRTCKHAGGGQFHEERVFQLNCRIDVIDDHRERIFQRSDQGKEYVLNGLLTFTPPDHRHGKGSIDYRFFLFSLALSDGNSLHHSRRFGEWNTINELRFPQQCLAGVEVPIFPIGDLNLLTPKLIQSPLQVILLVRENKQHVAELCDFTLSGGGRQVL